MICFCLIVMALFGVPIQPFQALLKWLRNYKPKYKHVFVSSSCSVCNQFFFCFRTKKFCLFRITLRNHVKLMSTRYNNEMEWFSCSEFSSSLQEWVCKWTMIKFFLQVGLLLSRILLNSFSLRLLCCSLCCCYVFQKSQF